MREALKESDAEPSGVRIVEMGRKQLANGRWVYEAAKVTKPNVIFLNGGLDEVTPPFELKPGVCRKMLNFEQSVFGGYRRIGGYERLDGQQKPSAAT